MNTTMRLRSELSASNELVEVRGAADTNEFEQLTNQYLNQNFEKELGGGVEHRNKSSAEKFSSLIKRNTHSD